MRTLPAVHHSGRCTNCPDSIDGRRRSRADWRTRKHLLVDYNCYEKYAEQRKIRTAALVRCHFYQRVPGENVAEYCVRSGLLLKLLMEDDICAAPHSNQQNTWFSLFLSSACDALVLHIMCTPLSPNRAWLDSAVHNSSHSSMPTETPSSACSWQVLSELLRLSLVEFSDMLIVTGAPAVHRGCLYNCVIALLNGTVLLFMQMHAVSLGNMRRTHSAGATEALTVRQSGQLSRDEMVCELVERRLGRVPLAKVRARNERYAARTR